MLLSPADPETKGVFTLRGDNSVVLVLSRGQMEYT